MFLNAGNYPLDLALRAHQPPIVLHGMDILELHHAGTGNRGYRLAGGIGYEVEVEIAHLWIKPVNGDKWGVPAVAEKTSPKPVSVIDTAMPLWTGVDLSARIA